MSFPCYENYKDSGVEWLGEVPEPWVVKPIKRLGRLKGGAGFPHDAQGIQGEELQVHKVNALSQATFDGKLQTGENTISRETAHRLRAYIFPASTLVFAKVGAALLLARICELETCACIDNNLMGLIVDKRKYEVCFVRYAMSLVRFDLVANPGAVPSVSEAQIGNFQLVIPDRDQQTAITTFLDHETAKIDALIAEQQRLIELLKEKRQALISHAVTKGLNPNAPMKDSGIEWLGEVPISWEISSLKRFWTVTDCKHITAEFVETGIPLASIREVQSRFVNLETAKQTTVSYYELLIEDGRKPMAGDLLFSRNATVGEVAQVAEWHPPFAMGQDVCLLRKKKIASSSDFLQAVLRSRVGTEQLANLMIGSTFKRINVDEIRNLIVPMPPPAEQRFIASFLEEENTKFGALINESQVAISLLQERRAALISAAVTGKIDVRGLVVSQLEMEAAA